MKYLNCNKSIYFPETRGGFLCWTAVFVLSMAHPWYKIYKGFFFVCLVFFWPPSFFKLMKYFDLYEKSSMLKLHLHVAFINVHPYWLCGLITCISDIHPIICISCAVSIVCSFCPSYRISSRFIVSCISSSAVTFSMMKKSKFKKNFTLFIYFTLSSLKNFMRVFL